MHNFSFHQYNSLISTPSVTTSVDESNSFFNQSCFYPIKYICNGAFHIIKKISEYVINKVRKLKLYIKWLVYPKEPICIENPLIMKPINIETPLTDKSVSINTPVIPTIQSMLEVNQSSKAIKPVPPKPDLPKFIIQQDLNFSKNYQTLKTLNTIEC